MTFHIQTDQNNRITDVITYPHEGYTPVELTPPLPVRVLCGAYELRDGMIIYRPEWDEDERIRKLETEIEQLKQIIAEIQKKPVT